MIFVFDENLPKNLAEGIDLLERGNVRSPHQSEVIYATTLMGKKGATDEELIEAIGLKGAVLVTQDKDFKNKKHYFALYKAHNVGILLYTMQSKDLYWDKVKSFIKNWEDIKQAVASSKMPFAYSIGRNGGVSPLHF